MSMASDDITIEILKGIRDEIRGTNKRLDVVATGLRDEIRELRVDTNTRLDRVNERLDITIARVDVTNERLNVVETTLLDVAAQQRFAARYLQAISERQVSLEPRVSHLEARVTKLESE